MCNMNKTKLIILITSFFASLSFFSCKIYSPDICSVRIFDNYYNCTCEIDKTEVPKNSFVKIKVVPDPGYYFDAKYTFDYYYKSPDEENTYYVLIKDENTLIRLHIYEKFKYNIFEIPSVTHGSIKTNQIKTYEGDTVTFTIIPDKYFYYDLSSIKVYSNYDDYYYGITPIERYGIIDFKQSTNNPNEFSFIMPKSDVGIYVDIKFAVTATSQKESFAQGEKIIFNINNPFPDQTYDLVLSENYNSSYVTDNHVEVANNIKLSDTFELPQNLLKPEDTGSFLLKIYIHGQTNFSADSVFVVNSANTPEGWRSIGIKEKLNYYYNSSLQNIEFFLSNTDITENSYINFKYTLENTPTSQNNENNKRCYFNRDSKRSPFYISELGINQDSFDTITVWIEDEDLKYISRKITVNLKMN